MVCLRLVCPVAIGIFLSGPVHFSSASGAQPASTMSVTPAALRAEARALLVPCADYPASQQRSCAAAERDFVRDYLDAFHGDYASQVDVAEAFNPSLDMLAVVTPDFKQACAWSLVVIETNLTHVDLLDIQRAARFCVWEAGSRMAAVRTRVAALLQRIQAVSKR